MSVRLANEKLLAEGYGVDGPLEPSDFRYAPVCDGIPKTDGTIEPRAQDELAAARRDARRGAHEKKP